MVFNWSINVVGHIWAIKKLIDSEKAVFISCTKVFNKVHYQVIIAYHSTKKASHSCTLRQLKTKV